MRKIGNKSCSTFPLNLGTNYSNQIISNPQSVLIKCAQSEHATVVKYFVISNEHFIEAFKDLN